MNILNSLRYLTLVLCGLNLRERHRSNKDLISKLAREFVSSIVGKKKV